MCTRRSSSALGTRLYSTLPVEAFATGIKIFDWQKSVLDCLIVPSKALDHLIFYGSKVRLQLHVHSWSFVAVWR